MKKSEIVVVLLGRLVQAVIGLISLRLLSSILPAEELGSFYLCSAVAAWYSMVLVNPIGMYTNRRTAEFKKSGSLVVGALQIFMWSLAVAIFAFPATLLLDNFGKFFPSGSSSLFALVVCAQVLFINSGQTSLFMLNIIANRRIYVATQTGTQLLALAVPLGLMFLISKAANIWLLGVSAAYMVAFIFCVAYFGKSESVMSSIKSLRWRSLINKQTASFAVPIAVGTVMYWFQTSGYRILVERSLGKEALGYLAVCLAAASGLFAAVEMFVYQYFFPRLYQSMDLGDASLKSQLWSATLTSVFGVYLLVFTFCILMAPKLLILLLPSEFHSLTFIFSLGLIIEFLRVLTTTANLATHSEWKTKMGSIPALFGASTVAIGYLIIPRSYLMHIETLPILLIAGWIGSLGLIWILLRKIIKIRLSWRQMIFPSIMISPIWFISEKLPNTGVQSAVAVIIAGFIALPAFYKVIKLEGSGAAKVV